MVQRAAIDRLEWADLGALDPRESPDPGHVDPEPIAVRRQSSMHLATYGDGGHALVRRAPAGLIDAYAASYAAIADQQERVGFAVPALRSVTDNELWFDRPRWLPRTSPTPDAVDAYVRSLLVQTCNDGTIVATGEPHVIDDGHLVCEDVFMAARLEPDERECVRAAIAALICGDTRGIARAVTAMCRDHPPGLAGAIDRSVLALEAEWTPTSFGLSLHHVTCAASAVGPRSEPLVLLADELLHRLDLAFAHRTPVASLSSPARVAAMILPIERCREIN